MLPAAVAERYAIPGVRFVPLEDGAAAFESAVLTHPDAEGLATGAFLRAVTRFSPPRGARRERRARPALRLAA